LRLPGDTAPETLPKGDDGAKAYAAVSIPVVTGRLWWAKPPKSSSKTPQLEICKTANKGSFCQILERQAPLHKRKVPVLKTSGYGSDNKAGDHCSLRTVFNNRVDIAIAKPQYIASIFITFLRGAEDAN